MFPGDFLGIAAGAKDRTGLRDKALWITQPPGFSAQQERALWEFMSGSSLDRTPSSLSTDHSIDRVSSPRRGMEQEVMRGLRRLSKSFMDGAKWTIQVVTYIGGRRPKIGRPCSVCVCVHSSLRVYTDVCTKLCTRHVGEWSRLMWTSPRIPRSEHAL